MSDSRRAPKAYAILIGINYYPPENPGTQAKWSSLNGCVQDILTYEALLKTLNPPPQITLLTARSTDPTNKDATAPPQESTDSLPTYEKIVTTLLNVGDQAQPGDTVFVAYSGHGSRAETVVPDWSTKRNIKGLPVNDEALCPWDTNKKGARVVRDFELNYLFGRMADKGIKLIVFLDSCQSGGATRAPQDPAGAKPLPRGLPQSFVADKTKPEEYPRGTPLEGHIDLMREAWEKLMKDSSSSGTVSAKGERRGSVPMAALKPIKYTTMTACLAHELAWEMPQPSAAGRMSWAMAEAFKMVMEMSPAPRVTLRDVYSYVFDVVHEEYLRYYLQSPVLLGRTNCLFPGALAASDVAEESNVESTTPAAISLHPVYANAKTPQHLLLRVGKMHGAQIGAVYTVRQWYETPEMVQARPPLRVTITAVYETLSFVTPFATDEVPASWAQIGPTEHRGKQWPLGCLAVPTSEAPKSILVKDDLPELQKMVYQFSPGVGDKLEQILTAEAVEPEFELRTASSGGNVLELAAKANGTVLSTAPDVPTLLRNAAHVVKYYSRLAIDKDDYPTSYKLSVVPAPQGETDSGTVYLQFQFLKDNLQKGFVNIVAFYFTPNYGIKKIYPVDGTFESVDTNDKRNFSFKASGGTVKLMIFHNSASYDFWELEELDGAGVVSFDRKKIAEMGFLKGQENPETAEGAQQDIAARAVEGRWDRWCTRHIDL